MEHSFTPIIKDVLFRIYGENGTEIYTKNLLIQYINEKTKSASKYNPQNEMLRALETKRCFF